MIVNTNPDFYKLFKSCVRWRDPSHTPAFLIIIIHEGGKPVKSETGFFWGEGGVFSLPARPAVAVSDAGACPTGCRLTLPLWCPQGGLPSLSPAAPAVSCLGRPHPPDPRSQSALPRREGGFLVYFAGGFAPGAPALNRLRHLQSLPNRCPAGGLPLPGTGYPYRCGV